MTMNRPLQLLTATALALGCRGLPAADLDVIHGDCVTVNGYLGIVTIGPPEFSLELG